MATSPSLSLSFSLRGSTRRLSRLFSIAIAVNGDRVGETEALQSPADFVSSVVVETGLSDIELILQVDGVRRGNILLRCEDLIQNTTDGFPLSFRLLDGIIDVYSEVYNDENVSHVARFQVSRRGILNTKKTDGFPECIVVISRRRRDGSWDAVYRSAGSLRKKCVGGQLLSSGYSDGSDMAVRIDAYCIGRFGNGRKPVGSFVCSLKYLRDQKDGVKVPLLDTLQRRAGFCILRTIKTSSTISWFDLDVFAFARGGEDKENLAMVTVNDGPESIPALERSFRIRAEELRNIAERKQKEGMKKRIWFGAVFKIFRLPRGMSTMNQAALEVLNHVERDRSQRVVGALRGTRNMI